MSETDPDLIECHECHGEGGAVDYWGEGYECPCCGGEGVITRLRADEWDREQAELKAYCAAILRDVSDFDQAEGAANG